MICGGGEKSTGWEQEMGQKRTRSVPTTTAAGEGSSMLEETEKQGKPHSSVIPQGKPDGRFYIPPPIRSQSRLLRGY